VERSESGLASGVLNAARTVGGAIALAVLATAATSKSGTFLHPTSSIALVGGYQRAFQISALITFIGLLVSFALPRLTGREQKVKLEVATPDAAS
jgi:hypothetical protein